MHMFGKTPAMVLSTTAVFALGGSAIAAQARTAAFGTTPSSAAGPGEHRGIDVAALAAELGVSQATLQTALDEVRRELGAPNHASDAKTDAERRAQFISLLAAKLGLPRAKLVAALDTVTPVRPAQNARELAGATR